MSESMYRLQLVKAQSPYEVVTFAPGGPHEMDLVAAIVNRVAKANVGWFQSQTKVLIAVEAAVKSALWDFKLRVQP